MSEKIQIELDGGHILGRFRWEETVDVNKEWELSKLWLRVSIF